MFLVLESSMAPNHVVASGSSIKSDMALVPISKSWDLGAPKLPKEQME